MGKPERPLSITALCEFIQAKHNMSLRALGRRAGVSSPTAKAWKDGRLVPTDSHGLTLAALADLCPVSVLLMLQLARTDCPESRALWRGVFLSQVWDGKRERRAE